MRKSLFVKSRVADRNLLWVCGIQTLFKRLLNLHWTISSVITLFPDYSFYDIIKFWSCRPSLSDAECEMEEKTVPGCEQTAKNENDMPEGSQTVRIVREGISCWLEDDQIDYNSRMYLACESACQQWRQKSDKETDPDLDECDGMVYSPRSGTREGKRKKIGEIMTEETRN